VGADIGFVPMHRGSLFVDQLQRAVFLDETAKCHHLSRAGRAAVNGFKDDAQLLPRSFLREFLLRAKVDGAPFAHCLPLLGDDVISIETLPVGWTYILTQPDAAGLESFLCQFEMPLSVDWGTSVG
jgi:hypothetical protein